MVLFFEFYIFTVLNFFRLFHGFFFCFGRRFCRLLLFHSLFTKREIVYYAETRKEKTQAEIFEICNENFTIREEIGDNLNGLKESVSKINFTCRKPILVCKVNVVGNTEIP